MYYVFAESLFKSNEKIRQNQILIYDRLSVLQGLQGLQDYFCQRCLLCVRC